MLEKIKIGFIGLGIMGKPMALNLVKAGCELFVYDIHPAPMEELARNGCTVMESVYALATDCNIIISVLPDSPQVREMVLGTRGLISGIKPGALFIDMSTIDAETIIEIHKKLKQKGVETLDAPVSGGELGAIAGNLSIMVGGDPYVFERALPIFQVLGSKINHMGAIGSGQITKSCSQIATALTTQGMVEAFRLAEASGVDLEKVRAALLGGFAKSRVLEVTGQKIINKDFEPGFKLSLYAKDLRIASKVALDRGIHLPGTALVASEMNALVQAGSGALDFGALIQFFENNK